MLSPNLQMFACLHAPIYDICCLVIIVRKGNLIGVLKLNGQNSIKDEREKLLGKLTELHDIFAK